MLLYKKSLIALLLTFTVLMAGANAQPAVTELSEARSVMDATGFYGTLLIHDLRNNTFMAGHAERVNEVFLPASTFKVFSSLVALETAVIADKQSVIKWDGVVRGRTETNTDLDMQSAFRLSSLPHFQQLVTKVGAERMQDFVDAAHYGNRDISGGIDTFWLTGGLRISPRQQVELLERLYKGELPFSQESMAAVRDMMVLEQTPEYTLRAKTGWATPGNGENIGWWIGWVERGADVFFFASVLHGNNPDESFGPARLSVVRNVLGQIGVLPNPN